jgi:hypothetical protein
MPICHKKAFGLTSEVVRMEKHFAWAFSQNEFTHNDLHHQGINMKKMLLAIWQAWYETRLAYAKRYLNHRLGG